MIDMVDVCVLPWLQSKKTNKVFPFLAESNYGNKWLASLSFNENLVV